MIYSMTGYANKTLETQAGSLQMELKSVNARYFDFQCRLSEEVRQSEMLLREFFAAHVSRGKLECRISLVLANTQAKESSLDKTVLQRLKSFDEEIRLRFPQARALSVNDILRWPGVLAGEMQDPEILKTALMSLAKLALEDFMNSRAREGEKLAEAILQRSQKMNTLIEKLPPLLPLAQKAFEEKMRERLKDALLQVDEERVRQEIVFIAQKADVSEEITRLQTHLTEVKRVLTAGGETGKRLDFLMQELNREANTLASKAQHAETSKTALELKLLIEEMREQIQNLS